MVDLEDLVRSSIQRHAELSPESDGLFEAVRQRASQQRRNRRWGAAAAATVVVTGVIAFTSTVLPDTRQTAPADATSTSQPPAPAPTTGPAPTTAPAPTTGPAPTTLPWQGPVKTVSYHGLEFSVPADWQLVSRPCEPPQPGTGTVILPASSPVMLCGVYDLPPGLTTIFVGDVNDGAYQLAELENTQEQDLDGYTVLRGDGPTVWSRGPAQLQAVPDLTVLRGQKPKVSSHESLPLLAVPDLGVLIAVQSPDPILAEGILDMVRIVDVDSNGCSSNLADAPAPVAQTQEPQLQVEAVHVSVCRYHYGGIARSATLAPQDRDELVDVLKGLRPGTASVDPTSLAPGIGCERTDGATLRILLTPQEGDPQVLSVDPDGCQDLAVTGAQGAFAPTGELYGLLGSLVDSHVGILPVP